MQKRAACRVRDEPQQESRRGSPARRGERPATSSCKDGARSSDGLRREERQDALTACSSAPRVGHTLAINSATMQICRPESSATSSLTPIRRTMLGWCSFVISETSVTKPFTASTPTPARARITFTATREPRYLAAYTSPAARSVVRRRGCEGYGGNDAQRGMGRSGDRTAKRTGLPVRGRRIDLDGIARDGPSLS